MYCYVTKLRKDAPDGPKVEVYKTSLKKKAPNKHELTREILRENNIFVGFDDDGQPFVLQLRPKDTRRDWKMFRNSYISTTKHEHGKDMNYKIVGVKINGIKRYYTLSNLVWIYYRGNIPEGYDVDHINDDSLDNRLENLQLLTRKENIEKRKGKKNQFK